MTTKEKMIDKIYEVMSDKTLSFGCVIIIKDNDYDLQKCRITGLHYGDYVFNTDIGCVGEVEKCIGHPVMIGDVLQRTSLHNDEIIKKWHDMRKPIDDQSEECITFIYNLTQDDN